MLCFLASFCSTAAKAFGPVWGIWLTLYTMGHMLLWGSALPHWGIHLHDDPGPPLNTAKLHTRHSCIVCDILCSCPRLPSRRPFLLFLLGLGVCVCLLSCPQCNFFLLHLGERSQEPSSFRMCFMVCLRRRLMLKHKPRKAFCRLWLLRPEESVPLSFFLSGGGCHDLN